MADSPDPDETLDSTLDFCSLEFDPLKALRVDQSLVMLPFPDVAPCYSLKHYHEIIRRRPATSKPSKREVTEEDQVKEKPKPTQKPRVWSILEFMPEQKEGPLGFLRDAMVSKKVVNVWIRHSAGLRGVCTGKIRAFDRHWNIVMFDVVECFTPIRTLSNGGKEKKKRERVRRRGKKKRDKEAHVGEKPTVGPISTAGDQKSALSQDESVLSHDESVVHKSKVSAVSQDESEESVLSQDKSIVHKSKVSAVSQDESEESVFSQDKSIVHKSKVSAVSQDESEESVLSQDKSVVHKSKVSAVSQDESELSTSRASSRVESLQTVSTSAQLQAVPVNQTKLVTDTKEVGRPKRTKSKDSTVSKLRLKVEHLQVQANQSKPIKPRRQATKTISSIDLRHKLKGSRTLGTRRSKQGILHRTKKWDRSPANEEDSSEGSIAARINWERKRYVKQLFIRGDNIMIITTCK